MAGQGEEIKPRSMVTTTGYWYSETTPHHHQQQQHNQNQNQIFDHHNNNNHNPEIYNLTTGMEMIGWKAFFNKDFGSGGWVEGGSGGGDEESSMRCVFPCEGNERPSQGLSLSLNSSNPSAIGLQSFELRHHHHQHHQNHDLGRLSGDEGGFYQIRNSKYLGAAQELLNEFCCLGTSSDTNRHHNSSSKILKNSTSKSNNQWGVDDDDDDNHGGVGVGSSSKKPCLSSLDLLELQKRKTKLLQMLEEVDKRYKNYCDQMKAVVSSFEAMAGNGAARVYSALASRAMSRHFRCLRDGIVSQIKAIKRVTSEKDSVAPGTTKGETPRLRILDQTLRQQRAFQQMSMMETHPWRPQRGLPERSVSILRAWLFEHFLHPYPSDVDKHILARQTGLSRSQVSNWFINARVRLWKPMVEEMYLEETKEGENPSATSDDNAGDSTPSIVVRQQNQNQNQNLILTNNSGEDQKPNNLVRIDSECISSIINNNKTPNSNTNFQALHMFGPPPPPLDFSPGAFPGGGGPVSLTLGLQQQGGGLGFGGSQTSSSIFYPRDQIEDCQTVPYSLLDNESQNLPYRNLMGAQLLHDLAG